MVRKHSITWGGRRPGAGRPRNGSDGFPREPRRPVCIALTEEMIEFLSDFGQSRSATVLRIIRERTDFQEWKSRKELRKKLDEGGGGR